jgi:hypothetical protein
MTGGAFFWKMKTDRARFRFNPTPRLAQGPRQRDDKLVVQPNQRMASTTQSATHNNKESDMPICLEGYRAAGFVSLMAQHLANDRLPPEEELWVLPDQICRTIATR